MPDNTTRREFLKLASSGVAAAATFTGAQADVCGPESLGVRTSFVKQDARSDAPRRIGYTLAVGLRLGTRLPKIDTRGNAGTPLDGLPSKLCATSLMRGVRTHGRIKANFDLRSGSV